MNWFLGQLYNLKLYWLILLINLLGVVAAEILATSIYRWVEGELTLGVHVAASFTVILIATPMAIVVHRLLKVIRDRESALVNVNQNMSIKNRRFRSLLDMSVAIQSSDELSEFLEHTLMALCRIYPDCQFALIIHGVRANVVRNFSIHGLTEAETEKLLALRGELIHQNYEPVRRALMHASAVGPTQWTFFSLRGRADKLIGTLAIKSQKIFTDNNEVMNVFVRQISVAAENKLMAMELEKIASTDALTDTYNRGFLEQELQNQILLTRSSPDVNFSLFVIDVNGLKQVNDTYGHSEGDRVITRVAKMLSHVSRESDVVARMGGDEFVLLCPGTSRQEAEILLERIREQEQTAFIETVQGRTRVKIPVSVSIGLTSSDEVDGSLVFRQADDAMYQNKKAHYRLTEADAG